MLKKIILNILSFDCGYKPLASCLVTINTHYKTDMDEIISKLKIQRDILTTNIHSHDDRNRAICSDIDDISEQIKQYLNEVQRGMSDLINNHIKLQFIKSDNIIPEDTNVKDVPSTVKMSYIKHYLTQLDKKLHELHIVPDIILCENQRIPSKKIQLIEASILYHYSTPVSYSGGEIHEHVTDSPRYREAKTQQIFIVNPTLKNKIVLSSNVNLQHTTFIQRYSTKHRANKMHCKSNFLYWVDIFNMQDKITHIKKTKHFEDVGDAFCQVLGWYREEYPTL